jgi:REP element-mobilizing transposase RayT
VTAFKGVPEICRKCAKTHTSSIHGSCDFCTDMRFAEEILCDLNRSAQSLKRFECFQFRPALRPVAPSVIGIETLPEGQKDEARTDNFQALLNSDRLKYQRALAVQRLQRNPDTVFLDLKYHLVWNVPARKSVFAHPADDINIFQDAFSTCTASVGGLVSVLWLAPDHMHVYVESDGENSIDTVVRTLKRVSETALNENHSKQESQHKADRIIWDNDYFVETIG